MVGELERYAGEPEMAERAERTASETAARVTEAFWDEGRGLFAEDLSKEVFTEHTQCLALLSGRLEPEKREAAAASLLADPGLLRTTIYFTHYLFEAYGLLGAADRLFERLGLWLDLETQGFKTTYEFPEPTRSDCHGWGAHPIYHYFATVLGIRPGSMGFETVRIAPQLGPLRSAGGSLVHPKGRLEVDFRQEDGEISGMITLPEGLTGCFQGGFGSGAEPVPLGPGEQKL